MCREHGRATWSLTAVLCLAAGVRGQSPLTTVFAGTNYLASGIGAVYFDLTVHTPVFIHRLDCNLLANVGTIGTIEVHVRPGSFLDHTDATGDWALADTGPIAAAGLDLPSVCVLNHGIGLPTGSYGIAIRHVGLLPLYNIALAGSRTYSNNELTFVGGAATTGPFSGTLFTGRIWNGAIHYTTGGGPYLIAAATPIGPGCYFRAKSFYETFPGGAADLAGARLQLTPNAVGGFDVARSAAAPIAQPAAGNNLNLARGGDTFVVLPGTFTFPSGAINSVRVFADGRVTLSDEGELGPPPAPTVANLLDLQPAIAPAWMDHAPSGATNVYATADATAGTMTLVWWNVPEFGAAPGSGNTFLVRLHANGAIELEYQTLTTGATTPCLVGFSPGEGALDPGSVDLSATAGFQTATDDPGLTLVAERRPVIGDVMPLHLSALPPGATLWVALLSSTGFTPSIDLAPIGAPGCPAIADPGTPLWTTFAGVQNTTAQVTVPGDPTLLGLQFFGQGAVLAPGVNTLGMLTSNGLQCVIGPF